MTPEDRERASRYHSLIHKHFGGEEDRWDTALMAGALAATSKGRGFPARVTRTSSGETLTNLEGVVCPVVTWTFLDDDGNEVWSGPVLEDTDFHQICLRNPQGGLMKSIQNPEAWFSS